MMFLHATRKMGDKLMFIQNLGITLLLGGLIGLERERRRVDLKLHEFGGIRTLALIGVYGYLVQSLYADNMLAFAIFTGGFALLVVASYVVSSIIYKSTGATSEIAAFFVYLIGILMGMNYVLFAASITLIVVLLLFFKEKLHGFAHEIERKELYDTFKFIAIVFVVLPLLPNQAYGPLEVLNPYTIWLMVILISTISFASYVGIKLLGPKKGIGLGGFLGGLVSSTAVAMSFSQMSRKAKDVVNPFVFGILISSSAMFFRVILEVSVLNRSLLTNLSVPMLAMGFMGIILSISYWVQRKKKKVQMIKEEELSLGSPFQLWPAMQFGLLFAAVIFISKFASVYFGNQGIYITAMVSGLVDVDAITVSMANLSASGDISVRAAAIAVTIATVMNTMVKGIIVLVFGSRKVGIRTFVSMLTIIAVGFASLLIFLPTYYGFAAI